MEFAARERMLQDWTRDRETFGRALARANQVPLTPTDQGQSEVAGKVINSGTAVLDAVATSLGFAAQGVHPKKAVLVISDGKDTSSHRSAREVQEAIRASEILVYALAIDGGSTLGPSGMTDGGVDARALRNLTDDTGGKTEIVNGFKNLAQATARLADEFNQQYVISYVAPLKRDGRWHAIKVDVRKKGSKVRARAGYTAS
jgi:Ca-activated chloride channel family protein